MSSPWEKYQQPTAEQSQPAQDGPWARYQPKDESQSLGLSIPKPEDSQANDGNFITDAGNLLAGGVNRAAQNARELVGRIPVVGESIVSAGDAVDNFMHSKGSETLMRENEEKYQGKLTQRTQEAQEKLWWDSETKSLGPAWKDPRAYASGIIQSLPEMALTMGPSGRLAKAAYTRSLAKTGSKAMAAKTAAKTAMIAGGIGEGLLGGADTARGVRDKINEMPIEKLAKSEAYQSLLDEGMSPEEARNSIAEDSATQGMMIAGVATGIFGGFGDRALAKMLTGNIKSSITSRVTRGAVSEGIFEELPQSLSQGLAENYAVQTADPTQELTEGVLNEGLGGLATGGVMGAGLGGVAAPRFGQEASSTPIDVLNSQEDATFENTPEPAQLESPGLQGLLPAPEQTFYADSQGNVQDTGPVKNVDGVMQPSAQGSQWINPANRADAMTGGPGMDQQTPLGEPAPLTGQFQHGAGQQPVQQQSRQGLILEGEFQRPALPAPDAIVVDGEGNAQRGATAPQVFDGTQSGGRGMDQQAPTAKRSNDQYDVIARANGEPFQTAASVKASKAFRDAKKAGLNPEAHQVDGGYAIRMRKDPERFQMRPESSEEFYANEGQAEAVTPEPAKVAQAAKPKTPEQQAEYSWGTMNTFERNKAVVDSLGYNARQADSIAGMAWSELSATDKQTLSDGMANAPAQRWDAPNQRISDRDRPVLQNRDRSTDASIAQMQGIKSNPDYNRLSVSRDFGNGAPVIEPGAEFSDTQLGRKEKASTSTGRSIEVQYATVEADQLLASNDALGNTIPEYKSGAAGKSRAIAGNGRVAGIAAAWKAGKAESYKQQMLEDTGHGIDPDVIKGMKQPVLVRIMPLEEVSSNIGDESNVSGQAGLSAIEQASTDMRRLDLASLELTADNELSEATVMGFVKGMPTSELGTLLTKSGRPTQAAYNRAETALFQQAYQSEALTENLVDLKGDAKFIMNALMHAAPAMAKLDGAGIYDIRPLVSEAAAIAVNARRTGTPLREYIKTDQIDNNPMVTPILEMMVESGNKTTAIGDKLISLAQLAYAEANKSGQDMFGEVQKLSPGKLMRTAFDGEQINDQENTGSPESLGDQGGPKPDDKPIERQPNVRAGQTDSGAVQAEEQGYEKRAAKPEQAEAVTDKWRKNYLLAAKKARELGLDPKQHGKLPGLIKAIDAATLERGTGAALELEQQTEESRAEDERTEKARLEEVKKAEDKKAKEERDAREKAADKQAIESSMDRFELGQSAEQQLSGQEDIFSTENTKAEAGVTTATDSAQIAVTDSQYNPNPSEAQKEAGNYKKAHVKFQGLDITIENPVGSERSGKDDKGKAWSNTMKHDYGYIKRTLGADGDHVDVFIGKNHDSDKAFVIDQPKADGTLDEHKVMLGFKGRVQALAAYKANYAKGWKVGPITEMSVSEFKQWLKDGDTTKSAKESAERKGAEQKEKQAITISDSSIETFNNWSKSFYESASGWRLFDRSTEKFGPDVSLARRLKETNEAGGSYASAQLVNGFSSVEGARDWAKANKVTAASPKVAMKSGAENTYSNDDGARYSKTSKSEPQNLYVAHNLSADNLRYASKLGGLAAPSIAIGNIDTGAFSSFGEITLLAEPGMIESSKVRTFDADIYTPRHPRSEYQLDLKAYKALSDRASKLPGELRFPSTSEIAENGANAFIYSDGAKMLYLGEQGKAPKTKPRKADAWIKKSAKMGLRKFQLAADPAFKKIAQAEVNRIYAALEEADPVVAERRARFYFDEGTKTISTGRLESMAGEVQTYAESSGVDEAQLRKDISAKLRTKKAEADFKIWADAQLESLATSKKIYTGLTAAGNRKYIDYNLTNIVKQMTRQLQGGEGFNYGAGSVRSAYANEMKTVESVKNRRDQIVSAEEFDRLKDESNKKLTDALEQLKPYYRYGAEDFGYNSDASSAIAEGPSGIREAFDLDDKGRKIVADLVGYLRNMPTEYFEAKAGRAVDLSEFSYAVVPKGTPSDVLTILRESGIKVKRYDADSPASREEAIRSTNDILFLKDPKEKSGNQKSTNDVKAEAITKAITGSPELAGVKVVQSFDNLPKSVRDRAKRDGVEPGDLRGIYSGGSTYVVADNHANVAEAVYTAVHEEVGHRGIRDMLGGKLTPTMERIYSSYAATAKGRKLIKDIREDYASVLDGMDAAKQRQVIAEELVAYAVQDGKRPTVIQRYISKVRELLRALFPQVSWTNTDILALGEQSRQWLRSAQDGTASGDAMYALRSKPKNTSEQFDDLTNKQKEALNKIAPVTTKQRAIDWAREKSDRGLLKIRQGIVDRYASLRKLDEAAYGDDFLNTDITQSAWVLARMASAASGGLHAMLNSGRIYLDPKQKVLDLQEGDSLGLNASLARLGTPAEIERFMGWIAGNRSAKLAMEGRENLFDAAEIEALRTLNRGTTENNKDRGALYAEVFTEFQQYRDDVLAIAEQAGIITPENRAMWRDEFYVPFYRVMEEEKSAGPMPSKGLSRQEAYKKLKGGKQNLNDLLQNTILNFNHLLAASMNNQAAAQAVDNAAELGIATATTESARDTKASTYVLKDGVKQWYNIDDPLVFEALNAISDAGLNGSAIKAMSFLKRMFTNAITVTPQFIVANLLRDAMSATATSPVSKNFMKNIVTGGTSWADSRKRARMLASGGAFSFGHIYSNDPHEMKAHLTRNLRSANIMDSTRLIPQALKAGWDQWNALATAAENSNRTAIFEQSEQSKGKLGAAFEARDLTDFSAHGAWPAMRFLIRVIPFLNARLQGNDKLYRAGLKPAVLTAFGKGTTSDKQSAKRFLAVTTAISMASMALLLVNNEDEEYRKLEEWQKDTYWFVRVGGKAFFIPKPFEVGTIATMSERLLQQAIDDKATGELFRQRVWHALTETFSFSVVPHAFQPVLEVYANQDSFTQRPIESMGMDRMSKGLRSRSNTTAPAHLVSKASRVLGDDFPLAVSPVQADHLIAGYFGQVGAWGAGIADTIWRSANGETEPAKHWHEYQPIRRFYKDLDVPSAYTRYSTLFYEGLRESSKAYADVKQLQKIDRMDEARKVINDKRDVLSMRTQLNKVQRQLTAINNRMNMIRIGKTDSDSKRRELDRLTVIKSRLTELAGKQVEDMKSKR